MNYSFDIEDAKKHGVDGAVMLSNLKYWLRHNLANGNHLHDDNVWTFNSKRAFADLFPFWSESQIKRILNALINSGEIITGNYNKRAMDRTIWYAVADVKSLEMTIGRNQLMNQTKPSNELDEIDQALPDSKQQIVNTDITITFDQFYSAYPKKLKRKEAEAKWSRMNNQSRQLAIDGIQSFTANKEKQFISAAIVYLNGERWDDEPAEINNDARSKQAISGKPDNKATKFHNRLKDRYNEAIARELDSEAVQQVPGDIRSQVVIGN
tara:strand:+ start:6245 stop:7045 length:801 start_codon:yes stop_codon:yes gene_type:complete